MRKTKVLIFVLFLAVFGLFFSGLNVKATVATSEFISVKGAQVRLTGDNGIKFVGTVSDEYTENVTEYGIAIAFGEATAEQVVLGGTVNGQTVLTATTQAMDEKDQFYISLIQVPENMYGQKVTARAYVKNGEEVTYGTTVATRSLGQVALSAKNAGETGTTLETVVTTLSTKYVKNFTDVNGNVYFDNAIYETNHKNLGKKFIADWNAKFETELSAETAFVISSYDSPFRASARNKSTTDPEGAKITEFFRDEAMFAKWGWILEYISEKLTTGTSHSACLTQIDCILNNKTNSSGDWYYGFTLISFLQSIFNAKGSSAGSGQFKFEINATNAAKLLLINDYNDKIYADLSDANLIYVGTSAILPDIEDKNGYDDYYLVDAEEVEGATNISVDINNKMYIPQYSTINYNVKFFEGNTELTDLQKEFTIESEDLVLPEYQKSGYAFLGWYDNPELTGDPITTISKGSTGNKVLYAKVVLSNFVDVNVSYDLNGGIWSADAISALNLNKVDSFIIAYYRKTDNTGAKPLLKSGSTTYWYNMALKSLSGTRTDGLYKVVQKGSGSASVNGLTSNKDYHFVIAYHDSNSTKSRWDAVYAKGTDLYAVMTNIPADPMGDSTYGSNYSIGVDFYTTTVVSSNASVVMNLPGQMLVPYKEGYTFAGWKSSVDSSVVTTYPGYTSDPGTVTYTAQWTEQ